MDENDETCTLMPTDGARPRLEFEKFFYSHFQIIWSYVARRVSYQNVDDVVSRSFAVAWQKFERIPQPPEDRLWLFGVARRCIADQRRSDVRQLRLVARASSEAQTLHSHHESSGDPRAEDVLMTIDGLAPLDREALQLVLWDGLSHEDAARVMECSVSAFESRYRRARNSVKNLVIAEKPMSPISDVENSKEVNYER